ncbi:hypothetical protein BZB76_5263 [Actinomadura pelletieri DSM 43383]|uniref:Membrane protein YkgB n=1 Tax=Actinomadura pelletieri DSM 43383 TaxID=1120940 RepID=A0A495QFZ1_9ACTN|nr:hypothetical protein [Actinomadura pelletieri]RKS70784.1 hypothetical protein BZB76_5263 [Actinomadura pelletieri DSM 43383]
MGLILRLLVAAGLAADAIVHWRFAPEMAFVQGGSIDGDLLFRVQAAIAGVVAVVILAYATRWSYLLAFLVAGSAVGALVFYYYVDVGAIGPLPSMHEPVWYTEKTISLVGEGVATVAALIGFLTAARGRRRDDEAPSREHAGHA